MGPRGCQNRVSWNIGNRNSCDSSWKIGVVKLIELAAGIDVAAIHNAGPERIMRMDHRGEIGVRARPVDLLPEEGGVRMVLGIDLGAGVEYVTEVHVELIGPLPPLKRPSLSKSWIGWAESVPKNASLLGMNMTK